MTPDVRPHREEVDKFIREVLVFHPKVKHDISPQMLLTRQVKCYAYGGGVLDRQYRAIGLWELESDKLVPLWSPAVIWNTYKGRDKLEQLDRQLVNAHPAGRGARKQRVAKSRCDATVRSR
jgi:hypothetical protein